MRVVFLCPDDHFHAPFVLRRAAPAVPAALLVLTPKLRGARRGRAGGLWAVFRDSGLGYGLGMWRLRRRYRALAAAERRAGRPFGARLFPLMEEVAPALGWELLRVGAVNGEESRAAVARFAPDALVTVFFNQIVGARLRRAAPAAWNVHPSLVPAFRGVSPALRVLVEGAAETGVSIHRLAERIDAGELLWQRAVAVAPEDSFFSLYRRLALAAGTGLCELLMRAGRGERPPPVPPAATESWFGPVTRRDLRRLRRRGRRLAGDLAAEAARAAAEYAG